MSPLTLVEICPTCRQEMEEWGQDILICVYCYAKRVERQELRTALARMKAALEARRIV